MELWSPFTTPWATGTPLLIASLQDKPNANEINNNLGQNNMWTRQFLLRDRL